MKCTTCGFENAPKATKCTQCGTELNAPSLQPEAAPAASAVSAAATTVAPVRNTVSNAESAASPAAEAPLFAEAKGGFRFFKNCAASLKRFSVLVFAINLFLIIIGTVIAVVLIYVKFGTEILMLLAVPIVSAVIILSALSRLASALIYGFSEIVEKYEDKRE